MYPVPPVYELFFALLAVMFDPNTLESINFAYVCSKCGHEGQLRDDGTRFFDHPKTATWIYIFEMGGRNPRVIILLLLHDIQEDSHLLSTYRINLNFGTDIALDLRALTKLRRKGKESTSAYLARIIAQGPEAILGKSCDRLHNLRNLKSCTAKKRRAQIAETRNFHIPLLIPALRSHGGIWAEHADQLENMFNEAIASYSKR